MPSRSASLRSVPSSPPQRVLVADFVDRRLARLLSTGPLLVTARNSGEGGRAAPEQAVAHLGQAVEDLARRGIDARPFLPSRQELVQRLADTTAVPSPRPNGRTFRTRHLRVDLREHGLVLLLQCGSGKMIDDKSFQQPCALRVAQEIRDSKCALVYTTEFERWGRGMTTAPVLHALQGLERHFGEFPFLGDIESGYLVADRMAEVRLVLVGLHSGHEADRTADRTQRFQRDRTPGRMVNGRMIYQYSAAPPPGLALVRLRDPATGGQGRQLLFIDDPHSRPDDDDVLYGLPQVFFDGDRSRPVDQVANVRWFFENAYTSRWDGEACVNELIRRQFSTAALRRQRGKPDAVVGPTSTGLSAHSRIRRSLLGRIDFYRTGRLVLGGRDGAAPVIIEDVWPTDGRGWVKEADLARIEEARAELRSTRPRPKVRTFSGQPVSVNGQTAKLLGKELADGTVVYYAERPDARQRLATGPRAGAVPPLPHRALAQSIAEAIAGDPQAPLISLTGPGSAAAALLEAELHTVNGRLVALQQAQDKRRPQLDRGSHLYVGDSELPRLRTLVEDTAADMASLRLNAERLTAALEQGARMSQGLDLSHLWEFLVSLLDPYCQQFRAVMRDAMVDFDWRSHAEPERTWTRQVSTFSFGLLLREGDGPPYTLPVHGQFASVRFGAVRRIAGAIARLRKGTPLPDILGPGYRSDLPALRILLGIAGPCFMLGGITDARLLRLAMALTYPVPRGTAPPTVFGCPPLAGPPVPASALPRLARQLNEPVAPLRRMHRLYVQQQRARPPQLCPPAPAMSALYRKATRTGAVRIAPAEAALLRRSRVAHEWTADAGTAKLLRCDGCGRTGRVLLRLLETDASVCRECRTDRAGVHWPKPYDAYRS